MNKVKAFTIICCLMTAAAANVNHAFASLCSISVTSPEPQTVHSGGLEEIKAGEHFVITTLIINRCSEDQPFVSIIEVRNSNEVTEYIFAGMVEY